MAIALLSCAALVACGGNSASHLAGQLDSLFGVSAVDNTPAGVTGLSLGDGNDEVRRMAVQADGKIVVVGTSTSNAQGGTGNIVVTRFNTDGTVDTGFGVGDQDGSPDGVVTLDIDADSNDQGVAIQVQSDGKIVVAGTSKPSSGTSNIIVARLQTNGSLDTTFGQDSSDGTPEGMLAINLGDNGEDVVNALVIQEDQKIVVVGSTTLSGTQNILLARLNTNGTPDEDFGQGTDDGTPNGVVSLSLGEGNDEAQGVVIDANGRLVLTGTTTSTDDTSNVFVARLNSDGTLDNTFGTDDTDGTPAGVVSISLSSGDDAANGIALQVDGKILIAGTTTANDTSTNMVVARLNSNGTVDSSFGSDASDGTPEGVVGISLGLGNDTANTVLVQSDGKILVSGYTLATDDSVNAAVVRLLPDGALDLTFGQDSSDGSPEGVVTISLGAGNDYARTMALQADGKILIAGDRTNNNSQDMWLARLLAQ